MLSQSEDAVNERMLTSRSFAEWENGFISTA